MKYLNLDVHGLIFETSVWLLAESTRLLPKLKIPSVSKVRTAVSGRNHSSYHTNACNGLVFTCYSFSINQQTTSMLVYQSVFGKLVTSDSEAHLNKPELLFHKDFRLCACEFVHHTLHIPTFAQSTTPASRMVKLLVTWNFHHRTTTCWTRYMNFTTTQSEPVNQLHHTNIWCEI